MRFLAVADARERRCPGLPGPARPARRGRAADALTAGQGSDGDPRPLDAVEPVDPMNRGLDVLPAEVYEDLRRVARNHLRRHRDGATLNTTAVVHEAYLKLLRGQSGWQDRAHFFALASTAMRQLLVDHARRRHAGKRGGWALHVTLSEAAAVSGEPALDILALNDALTALADFDPMLERVVECRFFAGLSVDETAQTLGRSARSVERDWARARAYLFDALSGKG